MLLKRSNSSLNCSPLFSSLRLTDISDVILSMSTFIFWSDNATLSSSIELGVITVSLDVLLAVSFNDSVVSFIAAVVSFEAMTIALLELTVSLGTLLISVSVFSFCLDITSLSSLIDSFISSKILAS